MLIAVVVLFFISWAPFHIQRLGYVYFKDSPSFRTVNENLFYISGCLYFLSSTLNPLLYNLMSAKYREAFKSTFCGWKSDSDQENKTFLSQSNLKGKNARKIPAWATQTSVVTNNGCRRYSGGSMQSGIVDPLAGSTKLPMSHRKLLVGRSISDTEDRNGDRYIGERYWQDDNASQRLGPVTEEGEDYC